MQTAPGRAAARLCAICTLLLLGCNGSDEEVARTPPSAPGTVSRAQPEEGAALRGEPRDSARRAMLSVYYHARFVESGFVPEEFRPMPLEQAVVIVREDRSPFGESRRRRAIAKLYAAPRDPLRQSALEALGAPLAELDAGLHGGPPPGTDESSDPEWELESYAVETLEGLEGASIADCERTLPKSDVSFDWLAGKTSVEGSLSVERDVDEMRSVIDPQNWAVCAGKTFAASYVTKETAPTPGSDPSPDPSPPTPGSRWSEVLFEHFLVDLGWLTIGWFKVLLDVDTKPTPTAHVVDYELRKALASAIGPLSKQNGGLSLDDGWIKATECGAGTSCVEATKVLKLEGWGGGEVDFWLNFWAGIGMEMLMDDSYESVCCDVNS